MGHEVTNLYPKCATANSGMWGDYFSRTGLGKPAKLNFKSHDTISRHSWCINEETNLCWEKSLKSPHNDRKPTASSFWPLKAGLTGGEKEGGGEAQKTIFALAPRLVLPRSTGHDHPNRPQMTSVWNLICRSKNVSLRVEGPCNGEHSEANKPKIHSEYWKLSWATQRVPHVLRTRLGVQLALSF